MSDWHRADHGDLPEPGSIISMVRYPVGDHSVQVTKRMAVAVVLGGAGRFYGPMLPFVSDEDVELPGRPDDAVGPAAIYWKETV